MKVAFVLGTRPEIIKMSPIIREATTRQYDHIIIHTNQHYSANMDEVFFRELNLAPANYNLDVGSCSHAEQTGKIMMGVEQILLDEKPDVVLVQGDTNSVLGGALAASKLLIDVGHVEAGLRSYSRVMPEETNRVLVDHCSDYLFAPTEKTAEILLGEGIDESKVFIVGNTIVDAVYQNIELARKNSKILNKLGLAGGYILLTTHRAENTNEPSKLRNIFQGVAAVAEESELPVIYPIHPRVQHLISQEQIKTPASINTIEPLGYLDFLMLQDKATLVLTDSGGVQEESCILKTKCLTLRENTERPETIDVGGNFLVGTDPAKILEGYRMMSGKEIDWYNPFGDGTSGIQILDVLGKSVS